MFEFQSDGRKWKVTTVSKKMLFQKFRINLKAIRIQLKIAKYHEFMLKHQNLTFRQPECQRQRKVIRTNTKQRCDAKHSPLFQFVLLYLNLDTFDVYFFITSHFLCQFLNLSFLGFYNLINTRNHSFSLSKCARIIQKSFWTNSHKNYKKSRRMDIIFFTCLEHCQIQKLFNIQSDYRKWR